MKPFDYAANSVYAKVHCIWAKRLTDKDYGELLNLSSVSEIAEYLKSKTVYGEVFEGLPSSSEIQRGQLENLLFNKLYNDLYSLSRFEKAAGERLFEYYIIKYDLAQLISALSCIETKSGSYLFKFPVFYNERSHLDLYRLARANTAEELLKITESTPYGAVFREGLSKYRITGNLTAVQAEFSAFADREFIRLTAGGKKKDLPEKSKLGKLYKTLGDVTLAKAIYRMKRFDMPDATVRQAAAPRLTLFTPKQLDETVSAPDTEALFGVLKKTHIKDSVPTGGESFQDSADGYLYAVFSKAVRRTQDPEASMFALIWLLENEIKNIIHITEGIRFGMTAIEILPMLSGVSHGQ